MATNLAPRSARRGVRFGGVILAAGLLLTACSSHHATGKPAPTVSASSAVPSTSSAAAELRAGLDAALRQSTNLTAFVAQQLAATGSPGSPRVTGALAALTSATAGLSQPLAATLGTVTAAQVLAPWRARVADGVAYAEALAARDPVALASAQAALGADGIRFAGVFARAADDPSVQTELAGALSTQAAALRVALTAVLGRGATAVTDAAQAARDMDPVALGLAQGIAARFPAEFPSSPDTAAAGVRAALTGELEQSVADITLGISQAGIEGDPRAGLVLAAAALAENDAKLAGLTGHAFGTAVGQRFGRTWSAQESAFGEYAQGLVATSATQTNAADAALRGTRDELGGLIAAQSHGALSAAELTAELQSAAVVIQDAMTAILQASAHAGAVAGAAESSMNVVAGSLAVAISAAAAAG